MGFEDQVQKVGDWGLEHIAHAPKDRPHADNHPGWGISGDAHHPAPPSKKNSKESSRKSVDLYPTGRRSFDMSNNIVGKALDTDVKTQQNLDKEGLSAFI